ncbi:glycosyltransferase family 8 protein [Phenylobacterium sp.]|uniref:glycosyltransferase family 8 protein n=1 Tax=Phenylobacterium sp. TaxID=1871053 RepID=UPI0027198C17|nr:glycosyltransferase family 8 protein [Phenylobacterium sp.]MDO8802366.1 glycosyltransferase family 8 protein [Phenylobacterium sp.]
MVHVAYCFDERYRQHFGAAITSLLSNSRGLGRDLCVHVVTDVADEGFVARIDAIRARFDASIEVHEVRPDLLDSIGGLQANSSYVRHLSQSAYFRLLLPDILPAQVERVLYLDSDTIVLSDISELLEADIGAAAVAGVRDLLESAFMDAFGYGGYINTGVLIMNLKAWRRDDIGRRCIAHAQQNPERVLYADQCCINAVLDGDVAFLDPKWNGFLRVATREQPEKAPAPGVRILHYVGADKPWQNWFDHPLGKHYWENLEASPWSGAIPDPPVSVANHHSLARKLAGLNRHAEACEFYEIVVTYLLEKSARRAAQDAAAASGK